MSCTIKCLLSHSIISFANKILNIIIFSIFIYLWKKSIFSMTERLKFKIGNLAEYWELQDSEVALLCCSPAILPSWHPSCRAVHLSISISITIHSRASHLEWHECVKYCESVKWSNLTTSIWKPIENSRWGCFMFILSFVWMASTGFGCSSPCVIQVIQVTQLTQLTQLLRCWFADSRNAQFSLLYLCFAFNALIRYSFFLDWHLQALKCKNVEILTF